MQSKMAAGHLWEEPQGKVLIPSASCLQGPHTPWNTYGAAIPIPHYFLTLIFFSTTPTMT